MGGRAARHPHILSPITVKLNVMRLTDEEANRLYRARASSLAGSWPELLTYHLGQLLEFTWNGKTISAHMGGRVASIISTDVFRAITISAGSVAELLAEPQRTKISREFYDCSSAVIHMLTKLRNAQATIDDDLARRCFLMLFLTSLIMKRAYDSATPNDRLISETDVFTSEAYPLTSGELSLVKCLPYPIFGANMVLSLQLIAISQNLNSLTQAS